MASALWWLSLNIFFLLLLSYYSMMEMACVSFNKIRLQYYVSKGNKKAILLNSLLQNPSYLFGTTLIGVNIALIVGSECAREFYETIGLNPDFAPLTQVIIVLIFGELAPMFAARRYAEHVSLLGIPLLYVSSRLITPILWCINLMNKIVHHLIGGIQTKTNIFITQEELQKILEEHDDDRPASGNTDEFNLLVSKIFSLRGKEVSQLMEPLTLIQMVPSNSTVAHMREILKKNSHHFVPVYHRDKTNIIGIAFPRDLLRIADSRRIRDHARSPWFVTKNTNVSQVLQQFRRNNQTVAVILNDTGSAIGILTFDDIIEEIFGKIEFPLTSDVLVMQQVKMLIVERTVPGDMKIADFSVLFDVLLETTDNETLADLFIKELGHHPEEGESIVIDRFEMTIKEASLLEIKSISIKTKRR